MEQKKQIYRDYPMSQREIAKALNISPMSVYEIEKKALKNLEKELARRGIKLEDIL